MFTPIWVIKLFRYPVPTKPFNLHSHHFHSCACLVLLGFWRVILPLAGVPEEQWDANGGQSHHSKCSPVKLENRHWDVSRDSHKKNKNEELLLVARSTSNLTFCLYCRKQSCKIYFLNSLVNILYTPIHKSDIQVEVIVSIVNCISQEAVVIYSIKPLQ